MAVVAAKNPPFKGVFLSPFVTVQTPFDISMCVFINYRSKMYLDPWKRFKGEIHEVLLVAYHNLSHKGKLTSWQVTAAWVGAEHGYMSNAQLFLQASFCSQGAGRTGTLPELPHFLSYIPRMPGENVVLCFLLSLTGVVTGFLASPLLFMGFLAFQPWISFPWSLNLHSYGKASISEGDYA